MAQWSVANDAHVIVHAFLGGHLIHNWGFQDAPTRKMKEMNHWVADVDVRTTKSHQLASGLDQFIRLFQRATFENLQTQSNEAIESMKAWLLSEDLTMNQLADNVDELYRFRSEQG